MFLMMMIACFASGALAILLAFVGGRTFMFYSIPGFIIGGFFAYKYATYDKKKARQEEHKRKRNRH